MARVSRGRSIANLLQMQENESIAEILPVRDFDERFLIMATASGQIKKTVVSSYGNPRKGGIHAIGLDENDRLIRVSVSTGENEILMATREGMAIRFSEGDVRPMGRTARGVRGISLRDDDEVVDMTVVDPNGTVLTVCEMGYGKRTPVEEYRVQNRGGVGIINIKTTERNGKVVGVKSVNDEDDLMLITTGGILIRQAIAEIRPIGRNTQGVRLIRLDEGDRLVGVARVPKEENGEE
jgi:DNA gyrase subunit A